MSQGVKEKLRSELRRQFGHVATPNSVVSDNNLTQPPHVDDPNAHFHSSSTKLKSNMITVGDDSESSAADNMKSLVQECGVSPHKVSELLQELPPQRLSDVLLDYYFTAMYVCGYMHVALLIMNLLLVETGLVIPSLKRIFALPTYPSAVMEEMELEQQISMMSVSSLCCSLFWRYQSGWSPNILLVMLALEGLLPSAITGLVRFLSQTLLGYLPTLSKLGDLFSSQLQSSLIHLTLSLLACW